MTIVSRELHLNTEGHTQIKNITLSVQKLIDESGLKSGIVCVFVIGSTAGVTTIEYEPGLVEKDFPELLDRLAPYGRDYAHNDTWGDDNGAAHLRAALIGPSLNIPFVDGKLALGTWQQIILIDFDTRARSRTLAVQLQGE